MTRGPRRSVQPDAVLDAALELIDEGSLTMRALATRVGLTPGALYTYFPDRSAIVAALADRLLAEADLSLLDDPSQSPHQRIENYSLALREVLLAHPAAVPAILGAAFNGPVALHVGESLLGVLPDARATYTVMVYVLGSIALEAADLEAFGTPPPPEPDRIAARRAVFVIDPEQFPRTYGEIDAIAAYNSTGQFRWGLHRVLAGLSGSQQSGCQH
ncbi:TetR/AcrR family transcriptional regulator [Rhizohabitans arisaemae]|uniref:TetR/AcrR family transcriptional regulator n=1 Tax=Rhizohabitans arisaemae TaxID=2720610 RepID=UPI0024B1D404|nr:TetR/AcrR family transcriptional regulator [Rhizohabitans arisaemae]